MAWPLAAQQSSKIDKLCTSGSHTLPTATAKPARGDVASLVALIVLAAGILIWKTWVTRVAPASVEKTAFKLPKIPSVAVLLFTNMSNDPDQGIFADGISEDIIADLSEISNLFVVAHHSTLMLQGKGCNYRTDTEELGVRNVLRGIAARHAPSFSEVAFKLGFIRYLDCVGHVSCDTFCRLATTKVEAFTEVLIRSISGISTKSIAKRSPSVAAIDSSLKSFCPWKSTNRVGLIL